MLLSCQVWSFSAFIISCVSVYDYFGLRSLIIGLVFCLVGIVPYALIGFAVRHYWYDFGAISGLTIMALLAWFSAARLRPTTEESFAPESGSNLHRLGENLKSAAKSRKAHN